jgi:S1-C subfamily serine protease
MWGYAQLKAAVLVAALMLSPAHAADLESIVAANEGAVLVITGVRADNGAPVQGSGVCVSPDGWILATAHQVLGVNNLEGRLADGTKTALSLTAADKSVETALLKSEQPLPHAAPIGDADALKSGAPLVSIAAPMNLEFSTVPGTVSNPNRTYGGYPVMQVVLTASHGSSGGPVFDKNGALVGLISGQLEEVDFTIVNRINNFFPLLRSQGIPIPNQNVPVSTTPAELELAPAPDATEAELRAVMAYNRGVNSSVPADKMAAYRLAVQLLPAFYEAWFNLGVAATEAEDPESAEAAYARAEALRPASVEVLRNLGRLYLQERQLAKAATAFERALATTPGDAQSHNDLGEVYRQMDRPQDAVQQFEAALAIDPAYAAAHFNLGLTCAKAGDAPKAARHFEQYLRLIPAASDADQVRAWINQMRQASK